MTTSRVSTNLFTVVSVLQLIFTIVAIAILSYKDYYQDKELSSIQGKIFSFRGEISSIRGEISSVRSSNSINVPVQTPVPMTTAVTSEQQKSARIRRVSQRKPSVSSSAADLQTECVQNMLKNLRVCKTFL